MCTSFINILIKFLRWLTAMFLRDYLSLPSIFSPTFILCFHLRLCLFVGTNILYIHCMLYIVQWFFLLKNKIVEFFWYLEIIPLRIYLVLITDINYLTVLELNHNWNRLGSMNLIFFQVKWWNLKWLTVKNICDISAIRLSKLPTLENWG